MKIVYFNYEATGIDIIDAFIVYKMLKGCLGYISVS